VRQQDSTATWIFEKEPLDRKEQSMDFVVTSYVPARNGIDKEELKDYVETLVRAVHPDVEFVGFADGNSNRIFKSATPARTSFSTELMPS